jgi:hypothetical protein
VTPAGQRLTDDEEFGHSLAFVPVVVAGRSSCSRGKWLPNLAHKLLAFLVQAHLRRARIIGTGIDFQNVLHAPDDLGVLFGWDGSLPLEPGLYGTFSACAGPTPGRWALGRTLVLRNALQKPNGVPRAISVNMSGGGHVIRGALLRTNHLRTVVPNTLICYYR